MLRVIDEVLVFLKNGKWQDLRETAEKCSLDELKVEIIVSFLSEYDFLELDKRGRRVRLRPLMLEFINEIQSIREEEATRS